MITPKSSTQLHKTEPLPKQYVDFIVQNQNTVKVPPYQLFHWSILIWMMQRFIFIFVFILGFLAYGLVPHLILAFSDDGFTTTTSPHCQQNFQRHRGPPRGCMYMPIACPLMFQKHALFLSYTVWHILVPSLCLIFFYLEILHLYLSKSRIYDQKMLFVMSLRWQNLDFEAKLSYIANSRPGWGTQQDPVNK